MMNNIHSSVAEEESRRISTIRTVAIYKTGMTIQFEAHIKFIGK